MRMDPIHSVPTFTHTLPHFPTLSDRFCSSWGWTPPHQTSTSSTWPRIFCWSGEKIPVG